MRNERYEDKSLIEMLGDWDLSYFQPGLTSVEFLGKGHAACKSYDSKCCPQNHEI